MDDDVEVVTLIAAVEGSLRGHDGIRRWWQNRAGEGVEEDGISGPAESCSAGARSARRFVGVGCPGGMLSAAVLT